MADDSPRAEDRTWPTAECALLVIPIGSTEQHGPHLPLGTDTAMAAAVGGRLVAHAREHGVDALLAPALPYGASGEHAGFAGTASIGTEALATVLIELGRSVSDWARRVVVLTGHGGNVDALRRAIPTLRSEGRDAAWLACDPRPALPLADVHAGRTETSVMLRLAPELVRLDRAAAGDTRPAAEIIPELRARGVAAVSPTGVLGDPAGADADEGERLLTAMADTAWTLVRADRVRDDGRLA